MAKDNGLSVDAVRYSYRAPVLPGDLLERSGDSPVVHLRHMR